jgi:hypothetical protein
MEKGRPPKHLIPEMNGLVEFIGGYSLILPESATSSLLIGSSMPDWLPTYSL